jgi:hypothetical protein
MDDKIELREAFRGHLLRRIAVFEWHSRYKAGRVSVEDDGSSGRPNTSKTTKSVEKIRELIHDGRRRTTHELADTVGINYGFCQEILTENLNMRRIPPSSRKRVRPHAPENHKSLSLTTWLSFPILPAHRP